MTKKMLRNLTIAFSLALAGIVVSLGMTIYTGVSEHRQKTPVSASPFPMPAY
jgi:hypothetical protein